jgi:hypothetical protein
MGSLSLGNKALEEQRGSLRSKVGKRVGLSDRAHVAPQDAHRSNEGEWSDLDEVVRLDGLHEGGLCGSHAQCAEALPPHTRVGCSPSPWQPSGWATPSGSSWWFWYFAWSTPSRWAPCLLRTSTGKVPRSRTVWSLGWATSLGNGEKERAFAARCIRCCMCRSTSVSVGS